MSLFPGANAQVYRNEAGEPLGWDYPSYSDEFYNDDLYDDRYENWEKPEFDSVEDCIDERLHGKDGQGIDGWWVCEYCNTPYMEMEEELIEEIRLNS